MHVYFFETSMSCLESAEAEFIQTQLVSFMKMLFTSAFIATTIKFPAKITLSFCSPRSRLALGPIQTSIHCIPGTPFTDMQQLEHEELMITHLNFLSKECMELLSPPSHIFKA
jgi:hypothetical protein